MNKKKVLGISSRVEKKEAEKNVGYLNSPCTVSEALQIASSVAADYISTYAQTKAPVDLSLAVQVEILKEFLFKNGILNKEEFLKECKKKMAEIRDMESTPVKDSDPKMEVRANEVEVQTMKE